MVSRKLIINVLVAFVPTGAIGFLVKDHIDILLGSPYVVAWSLFIGGFALIASDKIFLVSGRGKTAEELSIKESLILGVVQSIAMIPGVSRSAATILGGLSLGLSRKEAAEFSFLLAVPTLGAAGLYKVYKLFKTPNVLPDDGVMIVLVGCAVAFVVALLAIKFFISLLQRFGFAAFGYYRILIGAILLYLLMTHSS